MSMYFRFMRKIFPFYVFVFSFFIISQLGKHFFFPFSYLSGIRIDYLAPTLYFTDVLSLVYICYFIFHHVIPALRIGGGIQAIIFQFKKGNLRLDPLLRGDDNNIVFSFIFIFLLIINYFFALSKPLWFYSIARFIQWACIFCFFKTQAKNKVIFSAVLYGLFLGGFFELGLSLLQLSTRHSIQGWWYYLGERSFSIATPGIAKAYFFGKEFLRPYGTFSHPNSLAGFYLLLYSFILTYKRITNAFFKTLFLIITSALVLVSFSRTAIIVYVLINLIYFAKNFFFCRTCFIAKIIIALFLITFAFSITGDSNSFQKRNDFAQKSLSIIATKPFSGTGIGSYLIAQHQYPQKFSTFFEQPVHNVFLLIIAQLGIPLSILLFFSMYRYIERHLKKIYFLLPFITVLITGSVDHYWITLQQNLLVSAVIFGILFSYEETPSRTG